MFYIFVPVKFFLPPPQKDAGNAIGHKLVAMDSGNTLTIFCGSVPGCEEN